MTFQISTVPIQNTADAEAELNAFLRKHKVSSIDWR